GERGAREDGRGAEGALGAPRLRARARRAQSGPAGDAATRGVRALVLLLATACSHAATGTDEGDAATTSRTRADAAVIDAAAPPHDAEAHEAAPPTEAGPPPINGCATFVDRTADAGSRVIAWTYTVATDPGRCMTIGVGETVTWDGDLVQHPLIAQGGDAP